VTRRIGDLARFAPGRCPCFDLPVSRSLFVAGLQSAGVPGDPEATLARFERDVRTLRSTFDGLELVVAPELHLMALRPLLDEAGAPEDELAVEVPGELTERLGALARETGLWLVPGSVYERTGEAVANTAIVLSPAGELVASYRKCFPWQPYETSAPGTRTVCFDIDGVGRFGLAICHDGAFPEVFRSLAWQGAEAILQVTLTDTSDRDIETVVARANAYVNQVAVVNINAAAPVGNGRSLVVDAEGAVRYEAGVAEEVLTAVLDLDAVARVRERGAFGINRLWDEMDRVGPGLELPMYGGRYRTRGNA
jgi:formamidase